jgi:hypothetical protein
MRVSLVMVLSLSLSASAALAQNAGDRVLGNYQNQGFWYPATVSAINGGTVSVAYDDGSTEDLPKAQVRTYNWKAGSMVECDMGGWWTFGKVTSIDATTVTADFDKDGTKTVQLKTCRTKDGLAAPEKPKTAADFTLSVNALAREGAQGKVWMPAHMASETADGADITFAYSGKTEKVAKGRYKAFDWKPGKVVGCSNQGNADRGKDAATIKKIGDKMIDISFVYKDEMEAKVAAQMGMKQDMAMPIGLCEEFVDWWDTMGDLFKNHASYKKISKMPASKGTQPSAQEVQGSLDFWLQTADGGAYIKIKKCVVTEKAFRKMSVGDEHSSRRISVACAVGVPLPPKPQENEACIVLYADCEQEYLGNQSYKSCFYRPSAAAPSQIACKAAK